MPTTLPAGHGADRLSRRQLARLAWLFVRQRYLLRRIQRESQRMTRLGDAYTGRLLDFGRRWLACHAEIADLLQQPEPEEAQNIRAILSGKWRPDATAS